MKDSDIRITPAWLVDMIESFNGGRIDIDVCTEPGNPLKARMYYAPPSDGRAMSWGSGLVYCNPPFSRGQVILWATKAVEEAKQGGEIIMLTKDDCRTSWNAFLENNADARCRIRRGAGFLEPSGDGYRQLAGPAWGTALWYWGRRRRAFYQVFSEIGEVTQLLGPQLSLREEEDLQERRK